MSKEKEEAVTLDQLVAAYVENLRTALQHMPSQLGVVDIGLLMVAVAAGTATALGATPEQLEEHWKAVMRDLVDDAVTEAKKNQSRIILS